MLGIPGRTKFVATTLMFLPSCRANSVSLVPGCRVWVYPDRIRLKQLILAKRQAWGGPDTRLLFWSECYRFLSSGETDSSPHLLVRLLVNRATKPCPAVHICMKLEFTHLIANCQAVRGHSGFRGFTLHLVASQPLEPSTSGPRDVKVHVQPRLICYLLYHVLILVFPQG